MISHVTVALSCRDSLSGSLYRIYLELPNNNSNNKQIRETPTNSNSFAQQLRFIILTARSFFSVAARRLVSLVRSFQCTLSSIIILRVFKLVMIRNLGVNLYWWQILMHWNNSGSLMGIKAQSIRASCCCKLESCPLSSPSGIEELDATSTNDKEIEEARTAVMVGGNTSCL